MGRSIKCPKCQLWFSAEKYTSCPHCIEIAEEQAVKKAREKVITDAVVAYLRSEDAAKKEAAAKAAVEDAEEKEAAAKAAVEHAVAEKKAAEMMAAAAADHAAVQKEEAEKAILASNMENSIGAMHNSAASSKNGKSYIMPEFLQSGKKNESVQFSYSKERKGIGYDLENGDRNQKKTVPQPSQIPVSQPVQKAIPQSSQMPESQSGQKPITQSAQRFVTQPSSLIQSHIHVKNVKVVFEPDNAVSSGNLTENGNVPDAVSRAGQLTIGWLVGIAGQGYGTNIPLYKGRNLVYALTSAEKSETESERICAVITPEPEFERMAIYPGVSGSSCYSNGNQVEGEVLLNGYDYLIFEKDPACAFIYVPLENSRFDWSMYER